jgi:hypothetical protein
MLTVPPVWHDDQIGPFTWPQQKNITPSGNEFRNNLIWTKVPHFHFALDVDV